MDDSFFHDEWFIPKFESITRPSLTFQRSESYDLVNSRQIRSKSVPSIASAEKILGFLPFRTSKGDRKKDGKCFPKDSDVFWLLNDSQPK